MAAEAVEAVEVVAGMHADEAEAMFLHVSSGSCSQTAFVCGADCLMRQQL
jgi:hypothetical protein